jgi:uncharacterized membrane protein YhiD involved in acid resistance
MDTLLAYIVSGVCLQVKSLLTAGQLVISSKIEIRGFYTTASIWQFRFEMFLHF